MIRRKIYFHYALYIQIATFLGTFPGIFFQDYMIKTTGRVSNQVVILLICIAITIFLIIGINIGISQHKVLLGENNWKFNDYCTYY